MGDKPIKSIQGQGQDVSNTLQGFGVNPQVAGAAGVPLVLGMGVLNFLGAGGVKEKGMQEAVSLAKSGRNS